MKTSTDFDFIYTLSEEDRKRLKETLEIVDKRLQINERRRTKIALYWAVTSACFTVCAEPVFTKFIKPNKHLFRQMLANSYHEIESDLAPTPISVPKREGSATQPERNNQAAGRPAEKERTPSTHHVLNGNATANETLTYFYTVRKGNSVERIALKHGMSVDEVMAFNPFLKHDPNHLEYGRRARKIKVRAWKIYQMKTGDSFKSISKAYGISIGYLAQANPILKRRIKPGQMIVIPCPFGK